MILLELPPRARRIQRREGLLAFHGGTTSACAENTISHVAKSQVVRNYLRVRGEYRVGSGIVTKELELPPCARRIPPTPQHSPPNIGTTSVCAENT